MPPADPPEEMAMTADAKAVPEGRPESLPFSEVFRVELEDLRRRREQVVVNFRFARRDFGLGRVGTDRRFAFAV